jgi:hypothetical protein
MGICALYSCGVQNQNYSRAMLSYKTLGQSFPAGPSSW